VALWIHLQSQQKATMGTVRRDMENLEYVVAKEALLAGFDGLVARQNAMQQFRNCCLVPGVDISVDFSYLLYFIAASSADRMS